MFSRQLTEAGCSSGAGSHSKSFDHSHYRPYQGGGGDSGDALSVTSVSSSGSDLEDVNASFLSDSPEGHERKVRHKDRDREVYSSVACSPVWLLGHDSCFLHSHSLSLSLSPDVNSFSETYRLCFGERSSSSRYNLNGKFYFHDLHFYL